MSQPVDLAAIRARLAAAEVGHTRACLTTPGEFFGECAGCEARQGQARDLAALLAEVKRLQRENEWYRAAHWLIAREEAWAHPPASEGGPFWTSIEAQTTTEGKPALSLNMNDIVAWGTADSESFEYADAPKLLEIAKAEGWPGLVRWVSERRGGQKPQRPVAEDIARHDSALAEAKAEVERLREERDETLEKLKAALAAGKMMGYWE